MDPMKTLASGSISAARQLFYEACKQRMEG